MIFFDKSRNNGNKNENASLNKKKALENQVNVLNSQRSQIDDLKFENNDIKNQANGMEKINDSDTNIINNDGFPGKKKTLIKKLSLKLKEINLNE